MKRLLGCVLFILVALNFGMPLKSLGEDFDTCAEKTKDQCIPSDKENECGIPCTAKVTNPYNVEVTINGTCKWGGNPPHCYCSTTSAPVCKKQRKP